MREEYDGEGAESTGRKRKPTFGWRLADTFIATVKSKKWAELSAAAKAVYPVLWAHVNRSTWRSWPKVETIMELAGIKRAAVYKAVIELRDAGIVWPVKQGREGKRAKIVAYEVVEASWSKREGAKRSATTVDTALSTGVERSSTRVDKLSMGVDTSSTTVDELSTPVDYIKHRQENTGKENKSNKNKGNKNTSGVEDGGGGSEPAEAGADSAAPFDTFWAAWPERRKSGRRACLAHWKKNGIDRIAGEVMTGLDRWKRSADWEKEKGQYIPMPLKWLEEERWESHPPQAAPMTPPGIPVAADKYGLTAGRDATNDDIRMAMQGIEETRELVENFVYEGPGALPSFAPGFDRFWAAWPEGERKKGRTIALNHWTTAGLEGRSAEVLSGLLRWKASETWAKENGKYIPQPLKWLAEESWDAKPTAAGSQSDGIPDGQGMTTDRVWTEEELNALPTAEELRSIVDDFVYVPADAA